MKKKISFSLLALVISGCLLVSAGLIAGAYFLLKSQKNYIAPTVAATELPDIDTQMDQIQEEVGSIRGLSMNTDLDRALMSTDELKDVVVNDFFKDYTAEEAQKDTLELSTLGLLEPGFDLRQFYQDLYAEQIAGYYDSETKEMYVISDDTFGGLERMTYAHEFTHVLQDQNYDLENGLELNDENCEVETEYCAAVSALVEGDATLSEQYWFLQYSTDLDKVQVSEFQKNYSSPVYDSAPYYMQSDFLFSYVQGFDFVNELYGKNKWKSINEAYENPPVSTEQILHPERYPEDQPIEVELPDIASTLGKEWSEIDHNVMGEWYSYLILSSSINADFRLSEDEAKTATEGWGGDAYAFYTTEKQDHYLLDWHSTWDTFEDADEFFSSSVAYGKLRWGKPDQENGKTATWSSSSDEVITMQRSGNDVLWIISDQETAFQKALSEFDQFGG